MNKKTISLLIASVVLLIIAGGVVYIFDFKEYKDSLDYGVQIKSLQNQFALGADRNQKLSQTEQSLVEVDWPAKKAKMDANFISTPFFFSEVQYFFKDIIGRSKMSLTSLNFSGPNSINSGGQGGESSGPTAKNSTDGSAAPVTTSAAPNLFSAIQGPVRSTTVTMSVNGTYAQMKSLLQIFESQAYLISVKSIGFSGGSAINSYNITAEIYSY
jgi:hypothetical protein